MKISELINAVGDENIAVQFLDACTDTANMSGGVTRIRFGTNEPLTARGETDRMGVVVWLPRDAVKKAVAAKKEASNG